MLSLSSGIGTSSSQSGSAGGGSSGNGGTHEQQQQLAAPGGPTVISLQQQQQHQAAAAMDLIQAGMHVVCLENHSDHSDPNALHIEQGDIIEGKEEGSALSVYV